MCSAPCDTCHCVSDSLSEPPDRILQNRDFELPEGQTAELVKSGKQCSREQSPDRQEGRQTGRERERQAGRRVEEVLSSFT